MAGRLDQKITRFLAPAAGPRRAYCPRPPAPGPRPPAPDAIAEPRSRGQVPGIVTAWQYAQTHARSATRPRAEAPVLPWMPGPVPGTVTDPGEIVYLQQLRALIAERVAALREQTEAAVLAGDVPAWARNITTAYARYEHSRPRWLDHAQVVAAFRDQYPALTDDPGQPPGPTPNPPRTPTASTPERTQRWFAPD